ncbi:hypothetical protein B0H14DRAFT_3599800 [Mycena olivaceomarginata]|nr:hypothetical protein B0H14DRAFT_3599800 [Mycena olivaceomarginata]
MVLFCSCTAIKSCIKLARSQSQLISYKPNCLNMSSGSVIKTLYDTLNDILKICFNFWCLDTAWTSAMTQRRRFTASFRAFIMCLQLADLQAPPAHSGPAADGCGTVTPELQLGACFPSVAPPGLAHPCLAFSSLGDSACFPSVAPAGLAHPCLAFSSLEICVCFSSVAPAGLAHPCLAFLSLGKSACFPSVASAGLAHPCLAFSSLVGSACLSSIAPAGLAHPLPRLLLSNCKAFRCFYHH